ncbi:PspC domain-containing protein [Nocardiopsis sp. CNT312]|uniref:PspC domain-containing protein n=1 Tax=Nocardiopsis sp. CNT312 TaxID=1137268 RepID=UPI00048D8B9A|nr:PspC domain-containing protein [Nocardiopsis sp. CNT312]
MTDDPPGDGPGPVRGGSAGAPARELRKSDEERVLAGVCSGLGRYTDTDPSVWRSAFVLTSFAGGTGIILYVAAWMLMRDSEGVPATFEQMLDRSIPSRSVPTLLTAGLAAATALSLIGGFDWSTLVLATPLILGLLSARNRGVDLKGLFTGLRADLRRREPPPATPAPEATPAYYNPAQPWASAPKGPVDLAVVARRGAHGDEEEDGGDGSADHTGCGKGLPLASLALWTIGALAVVAPIAAFGWSSDLWSQATAELLLGPETGVFFLSAGLGAVGMYALLGTWWGNPRGLVPLGLALALAAVASLSTDLARIRVDGVDWRPTTVAEAEADAYRLTLGNAEMDLTGLTDLEPGDTVEVSTRVNGKTTLVLPGDARVEVVSQVGLGAVRIAPEDDGPVVESGFFVDHRRVFGPTEDTGAARDGGAPPTISVRTDSLVGLVEVRYGQT